MIAEDERAMFVLLLRPSRRRARDAAMAEVVAVLDGLGARSERGGPLSERNDAAWVTVPWTDVPNALPRLHRLGYTRAVLLVLPSDHPDVTPDAATVRWRKRDYALSTVYDEPDEEFRDAAPDRRAFLLECGDGVVRRIVGYRGGRGPLEHRALPVVDTRLLVNLTGPPSGRLLDPFAGAGGVVLAARDAGWSVVSGDVDPTLRFGLAEFGQHVVADARDLPLRCGAANAIATEVPYHDSAIRMVIESIPEMARLIAGGGRAALLLAPDQVDPVVAMAEKSGLGTVLRTPIDRKGTPVECVVLVDERTSHS